VLSATLPDLGFAYFFGAGFCWPPFFIMKVCTYCKQFKGLNNFNNRKASTDGKAYQCKDCKKDIELKRIYGITLEQYMQMFTAQNGKCSICKTSNTKKLHVDHCHLTNQVRGLLCNNCNNGLGRFYDNIEYLKNAILYLTNHDHETRSY
jgi:hypothetical protein